MRLILVYHSLHARDWSYAGNDHIALWHDLGMLERLEYAVVPLADMVQAVRGGDVNRLPARCAAITFDDGVNHDFIDFHHPDFGLLPSFRTIIARATAASYPATVTSFVIASPEARRELDGTCIAGRDDWGDDWWAEAAALDWWDIGNHSWDHNHAALQRHGASDFGDHSAPGQFLSVDSREAADAQIARARDYIAERTAGRARPWFAYPYGQVNDFLAEDYLPKVAAVEAAFTTAGEYLTPDTDPYRVPRFVCGDHWQSPAEFHALLDGG